MSKKEVELKVKISKEKKKISLPPPPPLVREGNTDVIDRILKGRLPSGENMVKELIKEKDEAPRADKEKAANDKKEAPKKEKSEAPKDRPLKKQKKEKQRRSVDDIPMEARKILLYGGSMLLGVLVFCIWFATVKYSFSRLEEGAAPNDSRARQELIDKLEHVKGDFDSVFNSLSEEDTIIEVSQALKEKNIIENVKDSLETGVQIKRLPASENKE